MPEARGRRRRGAPRAEEDPFERAVRYLARRPRTASEVVRHLRGRGCDDSAVRKVITRLTDLGYVDDRGYAERYIAAAAAGRPMGRRRLEQELLRRGVAGSIVQSLLESSVGAEEESAALEAALARALRSHAGPLDAAGRRRIAARLLRRGFKLGEVRRALSTGGAGAAGDGEQETRLDGPEGEEDGA